MHDGIIPPRPSTASSTPDMILVLGDGRWFSDTYVRTPEGWKYFFGQASLKLPDEAPANP